MVLIDITIDEFHYSYKNARYLTIYIYMHILRISKGCHDIT